MRKLATLLSLICLFQNLALAGQPARVWAVGDGEKVERDDLKNRSRASNSVWDGRRIRIFGARNEVIAFQVVVEAGADGIGALSVALPELGKRGGGSIRYARPSADPTDYAGRPIQLFSINYMNVTETTRANWVWRPGSAAAPADTLGWKPVQSVPENAKAGRGGFPLKVAPRQNQAVWVEIYTARDLPAGVYEGRLEVTGARAQADAPRPAPAAVRLHPAGREQHARDGLLESSTASTGCFACTAATTG